MFGINIGDSLLFQDDTNELKPGLAESWEIESPTSYLFRIRKGVTFHDDTPVDAAAVKVSLDRQNDPAFPPHQNYKMIGDVTVLDSHTLRVQLKYAFAPILTQLADSHGGIFSPTALDRLGKDFGRNPVMSGPFKFKEWVTGQRLTLVAHDKYWRGRPKIDELTFMFGTDNPTRVNLLRSGQIQVAEQLSVPDAAPLQNDPNYTIEKYPLNIWIGLGKNVTSDFAKYVRVRQALDHAIDSNAIINRVLLGLGGQVSQPIIEGQLGYNANVKPVAYDPDKARALLREAGVESGFTTDLYFESGNAVYGQVMQAVQGLLKDVGVNVNLQAVDRATLDSKRSGGAFSLIREGAGAFGEPDNMYSKFHSASIPPGGANYTRLADAELDRLLEEGRSETDRTKRDALYQQAVGRIAAQTPITYLTNTYNQVARQKSVQGMMFVTSSIFWFGNATV
jgi:peptide/nickel transport system substrate-binding protein